ncbi:hypothetical protein [Aquisphaera insulae]|uniref:hypothetical protein n=1 Tax=Aquisphaera insulae TaxID=2712864 RepID=UPI0013E9A2FE|nr:hypothetical protein [Aquisphaera insulae]
MAEKAADEREGAGGKDPRKIASLYYKMRKGRDELAAVEKERDALAASVAALTKERDELAKRADSSAASKRVAELTAELRGLKHRRVFDAAATKAGARLDAVGDLWQLAGYKAEVDEPDEAAIANLIEEQRTTRPYLFAETSKGENPGEKPAESVAASQKPGPGAGRGGLVKESGKFRVRSSDLRSREWMAANQARYSEALLTGGVELIDG